MVCYYGYHTTRESNIDSILRKGLLPKDPRVNPVGAYFMLEHPFCEYMHGWGRVTDKDHTKSSWSAMNGYVTLRINLLGLGDLNIDPILSRDAGYGIYSMYSSKTISPDRLEVYEHESSN